MIIQANTFTCRHILKLNANADANTNIGFEFPTGSGLYYPVSDSLTKLSGADGFYNVPGSKQEMHSYYFKDFY